MWKPSRILQQQINDDKGGGGGGGDGGGTPPPAWYPDAHKGLVEAKGFKSVDDVFAWGQSAEKLIGAERAGRTLIRPKDEKDADGIKAWRSGIGVPEKPEEYGLPVPEGENDGFAKTAASWFHEIGIGKADAVKITERWNAHITDLMKTADASLKENSEKQLDGLKQKWGGEFDKKSEEARRFMKAAGWDDEKVSRYESAFGTADMLETFASLGAKIGEAGFVKGDGNGGGGVTKQQALDKIASLDQQRVENKISAKEYHEQIDKLGPIAYAA